MSVHIEVILDRPPPPKKKRRRRNIYIYNHEDEGRVYKGVVDKEHVGEGQMDAG